MIHSYTNQRQRCPKCGKLIVNPMGNPGSPLLLVGDFPGYSEAMEGVPFSFRQKMTSPFKSGDVLQSELLHVGISFHSAYATNLWQHAKDEKECDVNLHLDQLTKLFVDRTHVLLMGSDVTMALIGQKIQSVLGLQVKVPGFRKTHFWVAPNPSTIFGQPIGELRLALSRFSEDIGKQRKN